MAEQPATPAPVRSLRLLPGDTAAPGTAAPGTGTDPGTVPPSVPPAALVPMSAAARTRVALKHRARGIAKVAHELWFHPDRLAHSLWNGKPESLAGYFAYIRSRAWVPPELTGWKAAVIAWAGFAYHALIGWPLACAGKLLGAAAIRPMRMLCLAGFLAVLIFLILPRL